MVRTETSARAAIIAGGRRRAPGSTFHENFSCYGSLSWSRGYARGGRSCAGRQRGRDAGVERESMEKGWGCRDGDRETDRDTAATVRERRMRKREKGNATDRQAER